MKTLHVVVLFAILGISLSTTLTEDMLTASDWKCIKEAGLDAQTVLNSFQDDFTMTEGDPKINEYTICWYKKSNGVDENNEINFDAMKIIFAPYVEYINNEITDKDKVVSDAIEFCKTVEGNDLGDRLIKFGNCAVNQMRKN